MTSRHTERDSSHRSSRAVDDSTDWSSWSDWGWDNTHSRWYRHRYDEDGQDVYEYSEANNAQAIPRNEAGSDLPFAYDSTSHPADPTYYENEHYTVDTLTRTLSSTTITPSGYANSYRADSSDSYNQESSHQTAYNASQAIPIATIPSTSQSYGFSASAPAGGYRGSHQNWASPMASGFISENSTNYYPGSRENSYTDTFSHSTVPQTDTSNSLPTSESHDSDVLTPKIPHKKISGTAGKVEQLDPNFKIHDSSYFKPCHVFKVLWSEPEGSNRTDNTEVTSSFVGKTKHGESVYTTIRRFVIVAADHGHCQCVPILTYHHRGTGKSGAQASEHAIIYTGSRPPKELKGEAKLKNYPIQVVPSNPRNKLALESRVNYAKIYTVEYNVKVMFIGRIAKDDQRKFMTDFDAAWHKKWKISAE